MMKQSRITSITEEESEKSIVGYPVERLYLKKANWKKKCHTEDELENSTNENMPILRRKKLDNGKQMSAKTMHEINGEKSFV